MKIYLTKEGKQEIEAKIAEILIEFKSPEEMDDYTIGSTYSALGVYRKILSSATILPVEESWEDAHIKAGKLMIEHLKETNGKPTKWANPLAFPQGVIIQPK
jgi:hypothetical protein